jgi:hypothetical protein
LSLEYVLFFQKVCFICIIFSKNQFKQTFRTNSHTEHYFPLEQILFHLENGLSAQSNIDSSVVSLRALAQSTGNGYCRRGNSSWRGRVRLVICFENIASDFGKLSLIHKKTTTDTIVKKYVQYQTSQIA